MVFFRGGVFYRSEALIIYVFDMTGVQFKGFLGRASLLEYATGYPTFKGR